MGFRREALDVVMRARAVGPLVGMRPDAELELQPAPRGLLSDEVQRFQIALPLPILQRHRADVITGHIEKVWIGEVQVISHHVAREIVAQSQRQAETVEAVGRQRGQVVAPERAVVKPGLVFHLADERARDAAHGIGGPGFHRSRRRERRHRIAAVADAVRQLRQGVYVTARIGSPHPQAGLGGDGCGRKAEALGRRRALGAGKGDGKGEISRPRRACGHRAVRALGLQRLAQFADPPLHGRLGDQGVGRIGEDRDAPGCGRTVRAHARDGRGLAGLPQKSAARSRWHGSHPPVKA